MPRIKGVILLFSLLAGVLSPFFVYSESQHLVINEVLYDPIGSDLGNEWIEIFNPTDNIIDLNNWSIEMGGVTYSKVITFGDVIIQPQSFFVVGELNIVGADLIVDRLQFQNGGSETDGIRIINQNSEVIDTVLYDEPNPNQLTDDTGVAGINFAPDVSAGSSLGRNSQSADSDNCVQDFIEYLIPSPGAENIIVLPNEAPQANAGSNLNGVVNEAIQFDASDSTDSNGDVLSFAWDFGDGAGSDQIAPTHPYAGVGNYLVTLSVSDGELQSLDSITVFITEAPIAPPPGGYSVGIIVSELLPNPVGSDAEGEFIELHNITNNRIDLYGWKLSDLSGAMFSFETQSIEPRGYLAVLREQSDISLNNSGGEKVILHHPDENVVNEIEYSGSTPEGKSYSLLDSGKWAWTKPSPGASNSSDTGNNSPEAKIGAPAQAKVNQEITFDASDSTDPDGDSMEFAWDFGDGQNGEGIETAHQFLKPGSYTVTLTAIDEYGALSKDSVVIQTSDFDYSENLLINEVMANVAGSDSEGEWIELVNTGDKDVDLSGWQVTDTKTSYNFADSTLLGAEEYLVITRPESKITLNNSAESILLIDPAGKVVNGVEYTKAPEDISFARKDFSDQWSWTEKPTPGAVNEFVEVEMQTATEEETDDPESVTDADIKTVKNLEKGVYVKTTGWVTVEPGLLGTQKFYIMDQQAGIQVYSSKKDFPELALGDYIQVTGKLSEASGEKKINISAVEDILVLEPQEIIPEPVIVELIDESVEGMLVTIEGPVVDKKGKTFYVDYGGLAEVKVSIKTTTNIDSPDLGDGQIVQVIGIVSQSNEAYQILPRYQEDIISPKVLGESVELSEEKITVTPVEEKKEMIKYLIVAGAGIIIAGAGLLMKHFGLVEKVKRIFIKK
ncbi:MAG: lamin tail domain-containing protein [Patescibacteria group bacterium]|jgi:PKD repeat protein